MHTYTFTLIRFYTLTLLHINAFTHKPFYTQKLLLLEEAFTYRCFYRKWRRHADVFTFDFNIQTLLHTDTFTHRHFSTQKAQTLLHTNTFNTHTLLHSFRAKGLHLGPWNRNFTSIFGDRTSFRAKGSRGTSWNRSFTSIFGDRSSFRVKWGLHRTSWNRNFTSIFSDRTSFRAKGLRRTTCKS